MSEPTLIVRGREAVMIAAAGPQLLAALREVFQDHDATSRLSWIDRAAEAIASAEICQTKAATETPDERQAAIVAALRDYQGFDAAEFVESNEWRR